MNGSKPCYGMMIGVLKEELEGQWKGLMEGERSRRCTKEVTWEQNLGRLVG